MSKEISKEKFIKTADSLDGSHEDYGLGYYIIAKKFNFLEDVYNYMTTKAKDAYDLDDEFYRLFIKYNPNPTIYTVED